MAKPGTDTTFIINNTINLRTDKMLMFNHACVFTEITWEKHPVESLVTRACYAHHMRPFNKLKMFIFQKELDGMHVET